MGREMAVTILEEVFDERRRRALNDQLPTATALGIAHALERDEILRLMAELVIRVERIDQARAATRAAEIRRMLERDDDVLRSPYARGKTG